MALNKTKTIRKRAITIYAPSQEIKENWYKIAKEEGMSVSNYIMEIIDKHIQENKGISTKYDILKKINDLEKQNVILRNENAELQKKTDMLNMLVERYENQLQKYRNKTFIENDKFEGFREYQQNLINLFKQRTSVAEDEIIDLLHIDPKDVETLKAISKQIDLLQDYGVIEKIRGGWRWKK